MTSRATRTLVSAVLAGACAGTLVLAGAQSRPAAVAIDADDIGGRVTGAGGPEAGVWVIAETTSLPTKFARIVVTDDHGRYLIPDLPRGAYDVFVRGYGLIDSPRVRGTLGRQLDLSAVRAPDPQAAAQVEADQALFYGQTNVVGWVSTAVFEKTKNAEAAQGWCPAVLDTNGDGVITQWTEPDQPVDPAKDHRVAFGCYSISTAPDGSVWCSGVGPRDQKLVRIERGAHPPQTCKAEVYEPARGLKPEIFRSGGVAIDSDGVAWLNWRGTDHVTSFDRRKCKAPLNGPNATGQHCPEGWAYHLKAGPTFPGTAPENTPNNTDLLYLTSVDRHDTLGLGSNVPVSGSVNTDALLAYVPARDQFVTLRVPYPMGFFARSAQGRIDDAKAGWKGKGLYSSYSSYFPWHYEGGPGTKPKLVKFQVRPDPLAK